MTMDIFATVLEAAGIDYAGEVEAQSFLPVLLGKTTAAAPKISSLYAVSTPEGCTTAHATATTSCAKHSRRTFHALQSPRCVAETTDLSGSEPAKFLQLTGALEQHQLAAEKVPWQ